MTPQSVPLVFPVRRCEPQLIVPARKTLGELKELSDIDDQQGLRFQIPFIMFYPSHPDPMKGKDPAKLIKEALGKALVYYYPFAGRLIEGPNRKLIVDCNGEGILFIEGDAEVTMDQLGDEPPQHPNYIEQLLYDVPGSSGILGCPLLLIQVTRLACGGFIFAVRVNHPMSDSIGLANFLKAVGEFARGASEASLLPVWQRHILDARNPPRVTCVHHEFDELITPTTNIPGPEINDTNMVPCSFFFGPRELKSIRKHIPFHLEKCSNFEVLTAFLWRSRTIALQVDAGDFVRLSCVVNARGAQGLQLPPGYYGNAFAYPAAISKAGLLCKYPLGYALELIRRLKTQMNEEYIKSVADLMVIKGRPHYDTVSNFLVVDVTCSGLGDVDFGWGKPIYAGPARAFRNFSIYCRVQNRKGENGTLVPMWLPQPAMERFKQELFKFAQYQTPADTDSHGIVYPRIITSML